MQDYRKNMLPANRNAIQINLDATISLLQPHSQRVNVLQYVGINLTYSRKSAFRQAAMGQHQGMAEHHNNYFI